MYKDRGIIKWAPFDALVGFHDKIAQMLYNQNKIEKPTLTEDKFYELDLTIKEAIQFEKELQIDYFEDGYIKTFVCSILKVDIHEKTVITKANICIKMEDIIDLAIYN